MEQKKEKNIYELSIGELVGVLKQCAKDPLNNDCSSCLLFSSDYCADEVIWELEWRISNVCSSLLPREKFWQQGDRELKILAEELEAQITDIKYPKGYYYEHNDKHFLIEWGSICSRPISNAFHYERLYADARRRLLLAAERRNIPIAAWISQYQNEHEINARMYWEKTLRDFREKYLEIEGETMENNCDFKIKKCPICGSDDIILDLEFDYICCGECDLQLPLDLPTQNSKIKLVDFLSQINRWNRRAN